MALNEIKIGLVDDQLLFRKGMLAILETEPRFNVMLEASDGLELMAALEDMAEPPEILLLDLEMPRMNGVEVVKALQENEWDIRCIVLSVHNESSYIAKMIELGASAYLQKNEDPTAVIECILEVQRKGFHLNAETMLAMRTGIGQPSRALSFSISDSLTKREREVLRLICKQATTTQIADALFISERTVDGHRTHLLQKTGCKNSAGLAVFAIKHKLYDPVLDS